MCILSASVLAKTSKDAEMAIRISKQLKEKLPQSQRANIEDLLWQKSGGKCFLCEGELNLSTDTIYADHDKPENEGGRTEQSNLNLVHKVCNDFKQNNLTVRVRPFLRFQTFFKTLEPPPKYSECLTHFQIQPGPVHIELQQGLAVFHLQGGKKTVPIFSEANAEGTFYYVYLEVSRPDIHNDDECQPRTIKLSQLWAIFSDLQRNPLHEPPSCRLSLPLDVAGASANAPVEVRLLMFDGQHKTLSNWLHERQSVVAKVYLNLDRPQTIRLVNSIQSKIKKLPLSPFELAAKMAEEWRDRVSQYEEMVDNSQTSEKGFMQWVGQDERTRAKQAFRDALVQNSLDDEGLEFKRFIATPNKKVGELEISETVLKNKVLQQLLHLQPLEDTFIKAEPLRSREATNIVRLLNIFTNKLFEPEPGAASLSDRQKQRAKRMLYQSSLAYISTLLKQVAANVLTVEADRVFLEREPTEDQWKIIGKAVDRILQHPVWTADYNFSAKMREIEQALTKNQNVERSLKAVGLKTGYALGVDKLDEDVLKT
jgi:5-methylcytosine-specific restriction endonuclease McrA